MPAVAEVQFKAQGSQQVVTAFNSVGSAAQTSATKVQQNSTAMKSMGQGMKSTVSGIGQAATAFATLSLSVVATWRAYRDLGDAQIAVDKANLRVKKTTEAIRKGEAEVAKLKKESAKGGLEQVAATHKIQLMEQKLAADRKSGKKTALELRVEEDAINLARKEGVPSSKKLMDAENKLALQKEQLGVQTDVAKEAQERFNDVQQNFYLSIAPLAISTIGTLATAFSGLKGMLTGGGGLVAGLGPIGLILGGISLAILAFKTNFLGLRDAVGGVIDWIKARFGVWKDTIEKVFNLIKGGKWAEAFNFIKEAAVKFWNDLKISVPFFGFIDGIIANIRNGEWGKAFNSIKLAAEKFWKDLKTAVPFLADIETFIQDIAAGNWSAIPEAIVKAFNATLGKGIEWIFGKNWKAGLDAAIAKIQAEAAVNKRSVPVQVALTVNQAIKDQFGIDIIKWFTDHPITSKIPFFGGITMMVDDPDFRASVVEGATLIIAKLGEAITDVAGLLDPYIAQLLNPETWTAAINKAGEDIKKGGQAIWDWIFKGIQGGFQGQDWSKLFVDFEKWIKETMPTSVEQAKKNAAGGPLATTRGWGIELNPFIPDNAYTRLANDVQTKLGLVKPEIKPLVNDDPLKAWTASIAQNPVTVPLDANTQPATKSTSAFKNQVERQSYIAKLKATTQQANQSLNQFVNKVNNTTATVKIRAVATAQAKTMFSAGARLSQHGYQGTVKRPTTFIAGEGGRPEDVTVRPRGSVQRGGGGGGGFYGTINVYVDGVLRPARYDMGARK